MITIVDYGAGNLKSVCLALDKIGVSWELTADPERILQAERIIFPGVGAARSAMANLDKAGLRDSLLEAHRRDIPFLGICLGTQIIFEHSAEDEGTDCLGMLQGNVVHFDFPESNSASVPHMGWNQVNILRSHPLFEGIEDGANFYFVHSYYPAPKADSKLPLASTEYAGLKFCCAVSEGNLVATQFHPEKSGRHGLQLLQNFAKWEGDKKNA